MRLINKDITYLFGDSLDDVLDHVYENERKYQGNKQHIRLRWFRGRNPQMEWWDERPGGSGHSQWTLINNKLYGHIRKYIGKKFDDCFSDFKQKVKYNKDWQVQACGFGSRSNRAFTWRAWRDKFLELFDGHRWRGPEFYVDDEGIIHEIVSKKKLSRKHITILEGEAYYVPNWGAIKSYENKLADARVDIRQYGDKISIEVMHRWESSFRKTSYWNVRSIKDACFNFVDNRTRRVIRAYTKEWYELKRTKRRLKYNKPDRSAEFDRSLWAQRYLKKHPNCGMGFHSLLNNNVETIRYNQFIETFKSVFKDPQSWTVPWGCTRKELWDAFNELLDEKYYVTKWFGNNFSNNFVTAELVYRINQNRKHNDETRSKQEDT